MNQKTRQKKSNGGIKRLKAVTDTFRNRIQKHSWTLELPFKNTIRINNLVSSFLRSFCQNYCLENTEYLYFKIRYLQRI